jgi:hypothetical protein
LTSPEAGLASGSSQPGIALAQVAVVVLALSMMSFPSPAAASVWDPNVDAPLDIRSISVVPPLHGRLNLTISFWRPSIAMRSATGPAKVFD